MYPADFSSGQRKTKTMTNIWGFYMLSLHWHKQAAGYCTYHISTWKYLFEISLTITKAKVFFLMCFFSQSNPFKIGLIGIFYGFFKAVSSMFDQTNQTRVWSSENKKTMNSHINYISYMCSFNNSPTRGKVPSFQWHKE